MAKRSFDKNVPGYKNQAMLEPELKKEAKKKNKKWPTPPKKK